MIRFDLVGANRDLFCSTEKEVILSGAAGTGKTIACLTRIHHDLLVYPGSRALILRKTRKSLNETGLATYENQILKGCKDIDLGAGRSHRAKYVYPNGSELIVGGMDNPLSFYSLEVNTVYVQECNELKESEWESLLRALRHFATPYLQLLGDCNPDHPKHWIKGRSETGSLRLIQGVHRDNPAYFDPKTGVPTIKGSSYLRTLDQLTGVRRERLLHGRWVASEGAVYGDFGPHNVIDPFPIPQDWRRICSIDFGFRNAFVAQFWGMDKDGRVYLYKEYYGVGKTVDEWYKILKADFEREKCEAIVVDHDAEDRATLRNLGVVTKPAFKLIKVGIEAVLSLLPIQPDGKPRLAIMRDSLAFRDQTLSASSKPLCLIDEIPGYCWKSGIDGKPLKEEPAPSDDHALDAMRYAVAYFHLGRKEAKVY